MIETSGLDATTEPWAETEAALISISFEFREIELVSSLTWRLNRAVNVSKPVILNYPTPAPVEYIASVKAAYSITTVPS